MNEIIETLTQLKQIIRDKKLFSVSDEEVIRWYNNLLYELEPLIKRHKSFSLLTNIYYVFIFIIFFGTSLLLFDVIPFLGLLSIPIILLYWFLLFLIYHFFEEPLSFISEKVNKERKQIREKLISLLSTEEELIEERLRRNNKRSAKQLKKELSKIQKLDFKLFKMNLSA
ncbi:MAG: hypothetical protein B6D44_04280 [Ignavibacteriales bacterium UTCHB2]|jgi:ABC-type multidrug transport system fused ATPase/permease subunit|nr:MAG: hypothetical protein B6D44_04280 [Ignavibacteriales bacterium UTCHB2]